ncbi:hypothetical protein FOA52_000076 [Chlamydomonas sp. UWO 241]|nr:hypothetical protein FOA52_000076 [Chlamydomonas sp. UWO 241]
MALPSVTADRGSLSVYGAGRELLDLLEEHVDRKDALPRILASAARLVVQAAAAGPSGGANAKPAVTVIAAPLPDLDSSAARCSVPDLAFSTPWGKFTLLLMNDQIVLTNAKSEIRVPLTAVKHVAILDRFPKDNKERVIIFIVLDKASSVMSGKQKLEALVLNTLADSEMRVAVSGDDALEGPVPVVLCSILGKAGVGASAFVSPDDDVYTSAKGNPSVVATFKANSGWLYPLEDALYFVEKPPMCILHADVEGYELMPRSSTAELVLHMRDAKRAIEFSFEVGEVPRLLTYLEKSSLRELGSEAAGGSGSGAGGSGAGPSGSARGGGGVVDLADYEDDDDDDDEDVTVTSAFQQRLLHTHVHTMQTTTSTPRQATTLATSGRSSGRAATDGNDHSCDKRPVKRARRGEAFLGYTAFACAAAAAARDPGAAGPSSAAPRADKEEGEDEEGDVDFEGEEGESGDDGSSEEESSDGECELIDEDDVPASAIRGFMDNDRKGRKGAKRAVGGAGEAGSSGQ